MERDGGSTICWNYAQNRKSSHPIYRDNATGNNASGRKGGEDSFNREQSNAENRLRDNPQHQNKLGSLIDVLKTFVSTVAPIIN